MKTLSLCKRLFFAAGSILSKFYGAAIEGLCGPGIYYGTAMAGVISRADCKIDRVKDANCTERPVVRPVA